MQKIVFDSHLRELEISINNICNLRCRECGFFIPHQPNPFLHNGIHETIECLKIFEKEGLYVGRVVLLGGEPLLTPEVLNEATRAIKQFPNISEVELVSNGLYPKGLSPDTIRLIDRFVLSDYTNNPEFIQAWNNFIEKYSSRTKFIVRKCTSNWDRWWGESTVSDEQAQQMYDACFYRRHCPTLERKRLFCCSRAAKLQKDEEGLLIQESITVEEIIAYLENEKAIKSCKHCIPMMDMDPIEGGVQLDNRIEKWVNEAIAFLMKMNEK